VLLSFPDVTPVEGGVPIVVNGQVVGAVGVSGVTSPQDAQVAQAGASAVAP
jgi:glc operon protein GlcG